MEKELERAIRRIRKKQEKRMGVVRPPCYPDALEAAIEECRSRLGFELPSFYRDFLRISNGWTVGASSFYYVVDPDSPLEWLREVESSLELFSVNEACRKNGIPPGIFVFGDNESILYCYDTRSRQFQWREKSSPGKELAHFPGAWELFEKVFEMEGEL
jgi:hypothetical protein